MPGVRHHDNGSALFVQFGQQSHHLRTVLGIQVTGRLIGKNQLRVRYHSAGNGHTLLLSAGKLLREVLGPVTDIHPFQNIIHHAFALSGFYAQICEGKFHILVDVQFVYQVKTLEHKSQLALAYAGTFLFFQIRHFLPKQLITALRRIIQQTEYIQQSGLATAGRPHNGYKLSLFDFEVYVIQCYRLYFRSTEYFTDVINFNHNIHFYLYYLFIHS
jgi:hypothetical protein